MYVPIAPPRSLSIRLLADWYIKSSLSMGGQVPGRSPVGPTEQLLGGELNHAICAGSGASSLGRSSLKIRSENEEEAVSGAFAKQPSALVSSALVP